MKSRWSDAAASEFLARYAGEFGKDLVLRTYSSRLIGAEKELVLHGGGNTSVKGVFTDLLGDQVAAIFVKASGHDLAAIGPEGHSGLALDVLRRLRNLSQLSDDAMAMELRSKLLDVRSAAPSIEALLHVFLPATYIDHTHADAVLALTNQREGKRHVLEALGKNVIVLEYAKPGFSLARTAAAAFERAPESEGMILSKHGLVTWGESARESYEKTIDLVTRAEGYLEARPAKRVHAPRVTDPRSVTDAGAARERYNRIAPVVRGFLAVRTGDPDWPYRRFILKPLVEDDVRALVDSPEGKALALTPPLTADHLIRTKAFPLWIDDPAYDDEETLERQLGGAVEEYEREYERYFARHADRFSPGIERIDSKPRVILMPGLGAICAGADVREAGIARDIAAATLAVKMRASALGPYEGLSEEHIFDMEYLSLQRAKIGGDDAQLLGHSVALVTGSAGAIGAGICEELLKAGCHVAVSDIDKERLASLAGELREVHGDRVFAVPLDVTDRASVETGFQRVVQAWGGVDLVVANAGMAHVSALTALDADTFRNLERVNIEGTLNVLAEAGRHFEKQGTGGDIVVVSTKNVFAPGATFGAYSATKAAAHQLARIASLEMAGIDVRVNMVSPDAVFSHGERRSGLWAEVGPGRMQARGLDEKGLEEYYRNRNLLKARVTAVHVAKAVLFFATRQTPTTGATIPVDGGLPDATPR